MAEKFTAECWEAVGDIFASIINHPFLTELAAGTLSREAFTRYLQQDDLYIIDDARALALSGVRAPNPEEMLFLLEQAYENLRMEKSLHDEIFMTFEVIPVKKKTLACEAYTGYLLNTAVSNHYEIAVASLLPCFWVYHEVGKRIISSSVKDNPYRPWIDTYGGDEFQAAVEGMKELADRIADRSPSSIREAMVQAFVRSTEFELKFYDSAYNNEP